MLILGREKPNSKVQKNQNWCPLNLCDLICFCGLCVILSFNHGKYLKYDQNEKLSPALEFILTKSSLPVKV